MYLVKRNWRSPYVDELLHLVREVAIVGTELQVEVDHGEFGARLHPERDGHSSERKVKIQREEGQSSEGKASRHPFSKT